MFNDVWIKGERILQGLITSTCAGVCVYVLIAICRNVFVAGPRRVWKHIKPRKLWEIGLTLMTWINISPAQSGEQWLVQQSEGEKKMEREREIWRVFIIVLIGVGLVFNFGCCSTTVNAIKCPSLLQPEDRNWLSNTAVPKTNTNRVWQEIPYLQTLLTTFDWQLSWCLKCSSCQNAGITQKLQGCFPVYHFPSLWPSYAPEILFFPGLSGCIYLPNSYSFSTSTSLCRIY